MTVFSHIALSSLCNLVKASPTGIFKRRYMDFYQITVNPIYRIHNPVGLILLTRLRAGLSSHLREHKFHHHFKDCENPYCPCDSMSVESVEPHLLRCLNHASNRNTLFENLTGIIGPLYFITNTCTAEVLLYGKNIFHHVTNKKIIESTINFILNTSRFNEPIFSDQPN